MIRVLVLVAAALAAWQLRWLVGLPPRVARLAVDPDDDTRSEPATGAVRSVQAAELELPRGRLDEIWNPHHLERLARTYWQFLTRATLGLIRVRYRDDGRDVYALHPAIRLLTFHAPEYAMDGERGIVRWRIEKGVLVSRKSTGEGRLEIEVRRLPGARAGHSRLRVEVEVANFYPAIAFGISPWLYAQTQSRIHVLVTHGFLRSLARLDLAASKVGRFARVDEVPDPAPPRDRAAA